MKRRSFFKTAGLFGLGTSLLNPWETFAQSNTKPWFSDRLPKNIIFMVSDGMSSGTLNMADIYLRRTTGNASLWLDLYRENKVSHALMDMASSSSLVTDSAAASSSWGSGHRVKNGRLNVGKNGEKYMPIWKKFKNAAKKAGCVTTVPITHATPAGFMINSESRNAMDEIAEKYLENKFDVLMGGGRNQFSPNSRKDGRDLLTAFKKTGYNVALTRKEMIKASNDKPILGVFNDGAMAYSLDRKNDEEIRMKTPTLAEMTAKAIEIMKNHPEGFVLQVEAGKVDWAAHANCIGGLLNDQVAFDEALKVAIDFADESENTLVVFTTDHGNANPGLLYGKNSNKNFDRIQNFKSTNEQILNTLDADQSIHQIIDYIEEANGFAISRNEAFELLGYYNGLEKQDDGLYNYKKLPYKLLADIQKKYTNVQWMGDNHTADYVELAMYGPGSEELSPFMRNTDLHHFLLDVTNIVV